MSLATALPGNPCFPKRCTLLIDSKSTRTSDEHTFCSRSNDGMAVAVEQEQRSTSQSPVSAPLALVSKSTGNDQGFWFSSSVAHDLEVQDKALVITLPKAYTASNVHMKTMQRLVITASPLPTLHMSQ